MEMSMAVYGPGAVPGTIPFTGFTPTLGVTDAIGPVTSGAAQFNGMTQGDDAISKLLFKGPTRVSRRLLVVLLSNNVGTNATETRTRVQAQQATFSPTDYGGLVPIEQINLINRNTTAQDLTNVTSLLTRTPVPAYVADVSGNAGGGKLGF